MSFLDNLENNLNAMERAEARDPEAVAREHARRLAEKDAARLTAPHAAALKSSPFTDELLRAVRVVGHGLRTMVRTHWREPSLVLEAREKRVELRPSPEGITAVYFVNGEETGNEALDLNGSAEAFARAWLEG